MDGEVAKVSLARERCSNSGVVSLVLKCQDFRFLVASIADGSPGRPFFFNVACQICLQWLRSAVTINGINLLQSYKGSVLHLYRNLEVEP